MWFNSVSLGHAQRRSAYISGVCHARTTSLSTIHDAVLEFLGGRDDAVVFGAQAVNAYVGEPRMSQDIDLVSTRATELAEELREYLTASLSSLSQAH